MSVKRMLAEDWRDYLGNRPFLLPLTLPLYALSAVALLLGYAAWRALEWLCL